MTDPVALEQPGALHRTRHEADVDTVDADRVVDLLCIVATAVGEVGAGEKALGGGGGMGGGSAGRTGESASSSRSGRWTGWTYGSDGRSLDEKQGCRSEGDV